MRVTLWQIDGLGHLAAGFADNEHQIGLFKGREVIDIVLLPQDVIDVIGIDPRFGAEHHHDTVVRHPGGNRGSPGRKFGVPFRVSEFWCRRRIFDAFGVECPNPVGAGGDNRKYQNNGELSHFFTSNTMSRLDVLPK